MDNIWEKSIVVFILAVLAAAGIAAIIFGVYHFWITKTGNKRSLEESEKITIISISFFAGLVGAVFLINQLVNDSKSVFMSNQYFNCSNSKTANGKEITENQCWYFQDLLNGKYVDSEAIESIEDSKHTGD